MRRSLNILVKILLLFVLLFGIVWSYLSYQIQQPAFQQKMITVLSKQIGREITVQGGCNLSFAPLGLKLTKVSLKSPSISSWAKQDFLIIGDFRLQVDLGSLLKNKLKIERVVIKDFVVNLLSDQRLGNNWSYWSTSNSSSDIDANNTATNNVNYLPVLEVDQLTLNNGVISLTQDGICRFKVTLRKLDINGLNFQNKTTPVMWLPTMIAGIEFTGTCHLDSIDWHDMVLRDIAIQTQVKDAIMTLIKFEGSLGDNANNTKYYLSGQCDLNGKSAKVSADWQIRHLQLQDLRALSLSLMKLQGTIDATGVIASHFSKTADFINNLNSNGRVELSNGVYEGIDIPFRIRRARDLLKKQINNEIDSKRTTLDNASIGWDGHHGVMQLTQISASTPDCTLQGSGVVNLKQANLDTSLTVQLKKENQISAPLHIHGALTNPAISLDLNALLKNQLTNLVPRLLNKKLGKLNSNAADTDSSGDNNDSHHQLEKVIQSGLSKLFKQ